MALRDAYYDDAFRVSKGGVPCRVFAKAWAPVRRGVVPKTRPDQRSAI